MYTGNIVKIERDENPNSPTYGTEREIVELSEICQNWQCRMVEIERETSGGVTMVTYEDKNENAPTFGKTITIASTDTTAQYLEMYSRCEQLRYHEEYYGNSGYKVATNIDANPNSSTYQQVVENVRTLDLVNCEKPNTNPIEEIETHCKLIDYASGQKGTNGVEVVEVYDMNPYSTTYWEKLREYERQSEDCNAPETTPNVIKICEYCEVNQQGKNTGYRITKQKDINLFSPNYDDDFVELRVKDDVLCEASKGNILKGYTITPQSSINLYVNGTRIRLRSDNDGYFETTITEEIRSLDNLVNTKGSIKSVDLSDLDLEKLISADGAFSGVSYIEEVNFGTNRPMNYLESLNALFSQCFYDLKNVDMSGWDLSKVKDASLMFYFCQVIETINLSGCGFNSLIDASSMFANCYALRELNLDGCDLSNVTSSDGMFVFAGENTQQLTIYARGCNQATIDLLEEIKPSYANLIY